MRNRLKGWMITLGVVVAFSPVLHAQRNASQSQPPDARTAVPAHDFSGVWYGPFELNFVPASVTMQPWAGAKFNSERTQYKVGDRPVVKDTTNTDPILHCDPVSVPRIYWSVHPFEIIQIPGRTLMYFEEFHTIREIWTDGRALPKDPELTWMGTSVGRWDGNDLVVDTVGFNDKSWLDSVGHPHSDALHLTERLHRVDHDSMQLTLTFDDPKAYTTSWSYGPKTMKLKPGWEIGELFCTIEDQKNFEKEMMELANKP
jgi:hypothetical protein